MQDEKRLSARSSRRGSLVRRSSEKIGESKDKLPEIKKPGSSMSHQRSKLSETQKVLETLKPIGLTTLEPDDIIKAADRKQDLETHQSLSSRGLRSSKAQDALVADLRASGGSKLTDKKIDFYNT